MKNTSRKVGKYAALLRPTDRRRLQRQPEGRQPPLADPTHKEFLQGQTTTLTYTDAGQGWKYKDSNYMWNKFEVDSKQYEKFEAEMAKKMGKM